MIRITFVAIVLAVIVAASTTAFAVEPGIYYCVTERTVGIQSSRELKENEDRRSVPRSWGKIKPNTEKFIVKIVEYDKGELHRRICDLLTQERISLDMARVFSCSEHVVLEAKLPKEKRGFGSGRGYLSTKQGTVFSDGMNVFWILESLQYSLSLFTDYGAAYLEEGHCETFE